MCSACGETSLLLKKFQFIFIIMQVYLVDISGNAISREAKLVGFDASNDLAVLKVITSVACKYHSLHLHWLCSVYQYNKHMKFVCFKDTYS